MNCPNCDNELGANATYCPCGWKRPKADPGTTYKGQTLPDPELGYIRCDWAANGERCRYPGSISSSTAAGGPWFCTAHFGCEDPLLGIAILERSKAYRHRSARQRHLESGEHARNYADALGLKTAAERRAWVLKAVNAFASKTRPDYLREPGEDRKEDPR